MTVLAELHRRLALTDAVRREHLTAGRGIDAAACDIRAQALREAIAIAEGDPLPPLRMRQSAGKRSAHA